MFGWLLTAPLVVLRWIFMPVPLAVIALLFAWVYYFMTKNFDFWKVRGVPGPAPIFPWGNETGPSFWTSTFDVEDWLYNKHGGKKFCGYFEFHRPLLFVGDPELVRAITIKDFEFFTDRPDMGLGEDMKEVVSFMRGAEWKETRAVMSPSFTSGKLKGMYQLILDNAQNLAHYVLEDMKKNGEADMKDMFGRFTMDNIASCAFGVNCNSFTDPNSTFATNAAKLFVTDRMFLLRFIVSLSLPGQATKWIPDPLKETKQFFAEVITRTMARREKNPSLTPDFLQLLMDTKDKNGKRMLSTKRIIAASVLFLFVGYDTTASLLTFAGYCLATNPEIQERVQEEVDEAVAKHDGLTHSAVQEMPYLDRVLSETLRLYPPATRFEREVTKDFKLPGTNVQLPVGTVVQISAYAMHRDPEHFPDPLRFDPDRFLPEEKEKRHPCAYVPFGSGPRYCLAMRFALLEAKVALAALMREITLKPMPETPPAPVPLDKNSFLLAPAGRRLPLLAVHRNGTK